VIANRVLCLDSIGGQCSFLIGSTLYYNTPEGFWYSRSEEFDFDTYMREISNANLEVVVLMRDIFLSEHI